MNVVAIGVILDVVAIVILLVSLRIQTRTRATNKRAAELLADATEALRMAQDTLARAEEHSVV